MATTPPHVPAQYLRKIAYGLRHLLLPECYYFPRMEEFHSGLLGRELKLKNGATTYFTEKGMEHFRTITTALIDSEAFPNGVDAEDIWQAFWGVFRSLFSEGLIPDSAAEVVQLVSDQLLPLIQTRKFILPFHGIQFEGITDLPLGDLRLIPPDIGYFQSQGLEPRSQHLPTLVKHHVGVLWITGKKVGSPRVAEREFRTAADLTAGLLATISATMLQEGASRIRIGVGQHGGPGRTGETWFSWGDSPDSLSMSTGGGHRPAVPIDVRLRRDIVDATLVTKALSIIRADKRNDLEESIARGLHWFADAHRDPVLVMQFVKYWSCIEVFFSTENKDITRSVSAGVAAALAFGDFAFVPIADYLKTKKRLAHLYGKRSKAVHGAAREHVTLRDIEELSKWTAGLLVTMLNLSERGYTDRASVKKQTMRLDAAASRAKGA